jgi:hypothetical protein
MTLSAYEAILNAGCALARRESVLSPALHLVGFDSFRNVSLR